MRQTGVSYATVAVVIDRAVFVKSAARALCQSSKPAARPRGNMRPAVKRRLVTLAAAASPVVSVATVALWVRNSQKQD
jgi:hypothetical protein